MGNEVSAQARKEARADELALVQAVTSGDVEAMNTLLKQTPQLVYSHSKEGENLWHFAAQGGHPEVLKAVAAAVEAALAGQKNQDKLKAQVNHRFNQVNQVANRVISGAVLLPAAIAIPMNADISINAQTRDGFTPLMAAVKAGKPECVIQLLAAGADAWKGDNAGATALHHAAWDGQVGCLTVLLQHAEQQETAGGGRMQWLIDAATNTGLTPLHYAAWKGRTDVLKQLVNAGAALAAPSSSDTMGAVAANAGSTPLHLAAMKGEVGIVWRLLRANAKLMAIAAAEGQQGAVSAIGGARSDVRKAVDKYGKTAAILAWDMQRSDLALILDPSTPLDQAMQLAAQAVKNGGTLPSTAYTPPPPPAPPHTTHRLQQQQQLGASHSARWLRPRKAGEASVDSGPSTPVVGSGGASGKGASAGNGSGSTGKGVTAAAAAGLQRCGKDGASATSDSSEVAAATASSGSGGGISLPPPKSWKSKGFQQAPAAAAAAAAIPSSKATMSPQHSMHQQQQQDSRRAHTSPSAAAAAGSSNGQESFGDFASGSSGEQQQLSTAPDDGISSSNATGHSAGASCAATEGGSLSDPPAAYVCPVTNELLKDPVRACDGLVYEREAIEMWFQLGSDVMPGGSCRITSEELTPDSELKEAIAAWKAAAVAVASNQQQQQS